MNLIERYVYSVTQRLPENIREDVSRELRANIEDMLPEHPTERDIRHVLEKLGNPVILANEYNPQKKYLIGPGVYDSYVTVLKLVIGIVVSVFVFISLFSGIFNPSQDGGLFKMSVEIIVDVIVAVIEGITQAFLWVTVTFIILERSGVNQGQLPFSRQKWSPDDLPKDVISPKSKISRGEMIFSMFFLIFFTSILYLKSDLIGIYGTKEGKLSLLEPLFVRESLQGYLIIILLLAAIQFGILVWKFISGHWTRPIAIANTIYNLLICALVVIMVNDQYLFNPEFLMFIENIFNTPDGKILDTWWTWSLSTFVVAFVVISIWDTANGFIKSKR